MGIFSQNKLAMTEIWITAWQLYRRTFSKTWQLGLILGVIATVPLLVGKIYGTKIFTEIFGGAISRETAITVAILIIAAMVSLYFTTLLLQQIYIIGDEQNYSFWSVARVVNKKYIKIAASMIIVFVAGYLGLLLLIFPGVFISGLLIMVQPLILFDNQGVIEALKRSWMLVWGKWWHTVIVVFLPLLAGNILMSLVVEYALDKQQLYILGVNLLIATLFYPFVYSSVLMVFNDLKLRKGIVAIDVT